jgi:hypothetical protein
MSNPIIGEQFSAKLDNWRVPPPPGFVGEIAAFIHAQAGRPVPEVAIAGALGLMAGLNGKAYATPEEPAGLNLFVVLVARSGIGKNAMHTGINRLMKVVTAAINKGQYNGWAESFVVREELASAPALIGLLKDRHSLLNALTEFGHIFAALVSPKANLNDKKLRGGIDRYIRSFGTGWRGRWPNVCRQGEEHGCHRQRCL